MIGDQNPSVTANPDRRDVDELISCLVATNDTRGPAENYQQLAAFLRAADGALRAGIYGHTAFGWLFISHLWVSEPERGSGLGARLLQTAEDTARARGCRSAWLDTYSFQAEPFYEHHGYHVFAQLPDYPPGHHRYFLTKTL